MQANSLIINEKYGLLIVECGKSRIIKNIPHFCHVKKIMEFKKTEIEGLYIIQPRIFEDERGYFYESFRKDQFREAIGDFDFVQDNQSFSTKNILRGLHFQKNPFAQGKLVRVIQGSVLDVAVDIRANSKTYGKHVKVVLTAENHTQFWVPPGFAHGFLTLEDDTIFSYKCTNIYNKDSEGGLLYNDPELNIDWSITNPILSEKDKQFNSFSSFQSPFND